MNPLPLCSVGLSRLIRILGTGVALLALLLLGGIHPAFASDHQDTALVANPNGGFTAADLTDLYVFENPSNTNSVVFAMDFDPLIPAGSDRAYDPAILYQFKIDNTGDFIEDVVMQFRFSGTAPNQTITMYGPASPVNLGTTSTLVAATGSGAVETILNLPNSIQLFAGLRKDPFYFDLARFFEIIPDRNYQNQPPFGSVPPATQSSFRPVGEAVDLLADFNVHSIVVELPRSLVGGSTLGPINAWMTTSISTDLPAVEVCPT